MIWIKFSDMQRLLKPVILTKAKDHKFGHLRPNHLYLTAWLEDVEKSQVRQMLEIGNKITEKAGNNQQAR